jgi:integrase
VPLAAITLDMLAARLAAYPAQAVELEDRRERQRVVRRAAVLMFTTDGGSPVSRSMWSQIWRPAARTAGLPERVGVHCLRHWYVSALIAHGESVKVVQRRLGHSSAAVTLDVYGHLWPSSDDQTRAAVEAALTAPADSLRTEGVGDGR